MSRCKKEVRRSIQAGSNGGMTVEVARRSSVKVTVERFEDDPNAATKPSSVTFIPVPGRETESRRAAGKVPRGYRGARRGWARDRRSVRPLREPEVDRRAEPCPGNSCKDPQWVSERTKPSADTLSTVCSASGLAIAAGRGARLRRARLGGASRGHPPRGVVVGGTL